MSYKKYLLMRLTGIAVMAILGVLAATTGRPLVLLPPAIIIGVILYFFSRRVNEVVVDERVNAIAYKSSRLAYLSFVIIAVIAGAILISLGQDGSPELFRIGLTLDFSVCALLVFYWLAFIYYKRKLSGKG